MLFVAQLRYTGASDEKWTRNKEGLSAKETTDDHVRNASSQIIVGEGSGSSKTQIDEKPWISARSLRSPLYQKAKHTSPSQIPSRYPSTTLHISESSETRHSRSDPEQTQSLHLGTASSFKEERSKLA
ncbi:hypothetical protein GLAREA_08454 [Glarea lozoyensis ATCC 20868]|uniref:Uncharacterized protein n=1 Tax=Glarea lozoyensis (strain ATCC 20868 / MF5171) TaxID=1116229 RepID=S3CXN6_GLAL2|nr:uncharacterized protein GLAREA_08454 [Glarea lozoyensis ATCC 20868]EPE24601.1 hypothetical protein GLAREA_08454 [Glarea lozoyensis ATCC 20868]